MPTEENDEALRKEGLFVPREGKGRRKAQFPAKSRDKDSRRERASCSFPTTNAEEKKVMPQEQSMPVSAPVVTDTPAPVSAPATTAAPAHVPVVVTMTPRPIMGMIRDTAIVAATGSLVIGTVALGYRALEKKLGL